MPLTYGPAKISSNRQIALPSDLMKYLRLAPGDQLYFVPDNDIPGLTLLVPAEVMAQWTDESIRRARSLSEDPTHPTT